MIPTRAVERHASDREGGEGPHPLPVGLGTLDAIHLATALAWREFNGLDLTLATHDARLSVAARALGLATVGG
jgi:predicted nucleic acid-binding protein